MLLNLVAPCAPRQAIALSYMLIVVMANGIAVLIVMTLHRCGMAAVGSPPVVQVRDDDLDSLRARYVAPSVDPCHLSFGTLPCVTPLSRAPLL